LPSYCIINTLFEKSSMSWAQRMQDKWHNNF